jgi:Uma2 family endonuclease
MEPPKHKEIYTIAEYLQLEGDIRYEFHDGVLVNMSGGTVNHARISNNVSFSLGTKLEGTDCEVFRGDLRIRVEASNSFLLPDVAVFCGEVIASEADSNSLINPLLLVEVLSESTKVFDRGNKFVTYQVLESFREYICIRQDEPFIDHYLKEGDTWQIRSISGIEKTILLETLDIELTFAEIYKNVF